MPNGHILALQDALQANPSNTNKLLLLLLLYNRP